MHQTLLLTNTVNIPLTYNRYSKILGYNFEIDVTGVGSGPKKHVNTWGFLFILDLIYLLRLFSVLQWV